MRIRTNLAALSVVFLAACASAGSQVDEGPTAVDPVGSYTLTTSVQGTPVNGQMRIRGEPGSYTGAIYTDFTGELPLRSITVQGDVVFLTARSPDGPVDIRITFDGDTFSGTWTLGAEGGAIEGRRVSG